MITRLAVKSSLLGGFGSAAYVSTIIDIPDNYNSKPLSAKISDKQKDNFSTQDEKTMTLEDVEMLEKKKNCRFAFVDDSEKSKNYTVREWFNEKVKRQPSKKD